MVAIPAAVIREETPAAMVTGTVMGTVTVTATVTAMAVVTATGMVTATVTAMVMDMVTAAMGMVAVSIPHATYRLPRTR